MAVFRNPGVKRATALPEMGDTTEYDSNSRCKDSKPSNPTIAEAGRPLSPGPQKPYGCCTPVKTAVRNDQASLLYANSPKFFKEMRPGCASEEMAEGGKTLFMAHRNDFVLNFKDLGSLSIQEPHSPGTRSAKRLRPRCAVVPPCPNSGANYPLFSLLDTMSPKEYQEIRMKLGGGSGLGSPGFRTLREMGGHLWNSSKVNYLKKHDLSLKKIYDDEYSHSNAYVVAEALADYDELLQRFRYRHLQHIQRSIGLGSKSLRGRPVKLLEKGLEHRFFPELWKIRNRMTDQWASKHGETREPLKR